jgi:hypothetical protein
VDWDVNRLIHTAKCLFIGWQLPVQTFPWLLMNLTIGHLEKFASTTRPQ